MTGKIPQLTKVMKTIGDKKVDWMDMPSGWKHHITDMCTRQSQNGRQMCEKRQITGKIKALTHRFQIKGVA